MNSEQQRYGLLFDVEGVLRLEMPRRQLGRIRALLSMSFRERRSILAMPRLVWALSTDLGGAPVFCLTALPIGLARFVARCRRAARSALRWHCSARPGVAGWDPSVR